LLAKRAREPDDDGFVLVTSRTNKKRSKKSTSDSTKRGTGDVRNRDKKKPKNLELQDFYRFQIREKKVAKLTDLKKKFEEDRAKIAVLKAQRRFNPY
jgi:ribosomal RNA-processing protein 7